MPSFILMMFTVLLPGGNLGISTLLGTDAINVFLIIGIIQYSTDETVKMDLWVFMKDAFFYIVALILLVAFYSLDKFVWEYALTWILYFLLYTFFFQRNNDHLKDKVYSLLGLVSEDDAFSSEDQLSWKPRRESVSELLREGHIKLDDPVLKKKLNRKEVALRLEVNGDNRKFKLLMPLQRMTYTILHGIQNKIESEKTFRTTYFKEMRDKVLKGPRRNLSTVREDNDKPEFAPTSRKGIDEDRPLVENQTDKSNLQAPNSDNELLENNLDREPIEPNKPIIAPSQHYDDEIDEDDYNLTPPKKMLAKITFYLFFPIHMMLFFLLPNFTKQANKEKVIISLVVLLSIQTGVIFLIVFFISAVMFGWNIQDETFGICFNSIGMSLPFIIYNIQLAKHDKDVSFFTTFQMIGTYKWGFGAAIPWMLYFILGNATVSVNTVGLQVMIIIFFSMFMILFIWVCRNKARVLKKMYPYFLAAYGIFFICGASIPESLNNEIGENGG